jgi:hypothetical protein
MKTLQSNFTTPEQSKRLLELGVPTDSADCYYVSYKDSEDYEISIRTKGDTGNAFFKVVPYIPCWSVGRLIEIYEIVGENAGQCVTTTKCTSRIDNFVQLYEENATLLDFSKLDGV